MSNLKKFLSLIIILFVVSESVYAEGWDFYLEDVNVVTRWEFDFAGYSDGFYWGDSNRHPYYPYGGSHEMLSGEHAAALAWSQSGSNQAIWLPTDFVSHIFQPTLYFKNTAIHNML